MSSIIITAIEEQSGRIVDQLIGSQSFVEFEDIGVLIISSTAMTEVLSVLQSECPLLEFKLTDDRSITVFIHGFWSGIAVKEGSTWEINEDVRLIARNYNSFKAREQTLLVDPTTVGAYLVVNSDSSMFLYETEDAALRGKRDAHAFVGSIGRTKHKQETLALDPIEKPDDFDDFATRLYF